MKRCITTHVVPAFGEIPAGSLWDDDSEYVLDENAALFVDANPPEPDPEPDLEPAPAPVKRPVRKFGAKTVKASD